MLPILLILVSCFSKLLHSFYLVYSWLRFYRPPFIYRQLPLHAIECTLQLKVLQSIICVHPFIRIIVLYMVKLHSSYITKTSKIFMLFLKKQHTKTKKHCEICNVRISRSQQHKDESSRNHASRLCYLGKEKRTDFVQSNNLD